MTKSKIDDKAQKTKKSNESKTTINIEYEISLIPK